MFGVFRKAFGRKPNSREILVMNRLVRLYGEDITRNAIELSIVVTNGSPVNYMVKVANNLANNSMDIDYAYLERIGTKQMEDFDGISG